MLAWDRCQPLEEGDRPRRSAGKQWERLDSRNFKRAEDSHSLLERLPFWG